MSKFNFVHFFSGMKLQFRDGANWGPFKLNFHCWDTLRETQILWRRVSDFMGQISAQPLLYGEGGLIILLMGRNVSRGQI